MAKSLRTPSHDFRARRGEDPVDDSIEVPAAVLVAARAADGLALERGARSSGAGGARGRALRFGLYATGWDLVLGPVGAIVLGINEGLGASCALVSLGVGLPGRCARAF